MSIKLIAYKLALDYARSNPPPIASGVFMLATTVPETDKTGVMDNKVDDFNLSFIVAGFSKCGTTSLCTMLAQHPQVAFSNPKEPLFFIRDDFEKHWDIYHSVFPPPDANRFFGEGSTFYSGYQFEQKTRDAILKHFPDIKLIFVARDPFERIESSYREFHHSAPMFGFDTPYGIANALGTLPALLEDSKYWARISCYREKISDDRILVLFLEDLKRDPVGELKRCFNHLGVDSNIQHDLLAHKNAGERKYYDSKLLRRLRNTEIIGPLISKIPVHTQNQWFPKLKLRRKFIGPIEWDTDSKRRIVESLEQDIYQFLKFYGKPHDYWRRFANECGLV
ncbi:MAG TPA: sulfotransferase [Spongiibacteraceae bacterium]|nr:sulfotransferase [Spongiibacteraceae bacterium]